MSSSPISLASIAFAYGVGSKNVFSDVSLAIAPRARVVLVLYCSLSNIISITYCAHDI